MPTRAHAPLGSPCWTDLWTSDVDGSRRFYSELFGWEAQAPSPEFGGYFMFTREGIPVAGGMGGRGEMTPDNRWKVFLDTDDISATLKAAEAEGGQVLAGAMPVADLGIQAVLLDPSGATVGVWQAGTFPGFTVLDEPGAPSWFELHTRDYPAALGFYRSVFHWNTTAVSDSDDFRYSIVAHPDVDPHSAAAADSALAGLFDIGSAPAGAASQWGVYWEVEHTDAAVGRVEALGGSVVDAAQDTPYGRIATVADPSGAQFKLRTGPR
jgi:predicted enzyme related to lactoylglutathione lyase